jgi:hypothetical protein
MVRAVRGLLPVFVLCSVLVTPVVFTPPLAAGQRGAARLPVSVGDTGAVVGGSPVADALEVALHDAIAARPDLRDESLPRRARYVVTGSVTELHTEATSGGHEVRIAVSIVVADRGGSVRAMLAGRAGASGGDDPSRLTESAMRAAVRSAMRPLGATLR